MIDLSRLDPKLLALEPYEWAFIDKLFSPQDVADLAHTFPHDNFRVVSGYDGEKSYGYEVRSLIAMGADDLSHPEGLSPAWRRLAAALLAPEYRAALERLVGRELGSLWMEVNVFHYGPGAWLGPHVDLEDKLLTHIFYFNDEWGAEDGGCLSILRSSDIANRVFHVPPLAGNSVVLVRSGKSWHAVSPVTSVTGRSRRSMTVSFHRAGSISTLWPPGVQSPLHQYNGTPRDELLSGIPGPVTRIRRRMAHLIRASARQRFRRA